MQKAIIGMQITSIKIKNFRALVDVEIPLARSTVIIGENNSGKSSVLDCISLALGRRWGQRGTGFSDYDLNVPDESPPNAAEKDDDAESQEAVQSEADESPPEASIELLFSEGQVNEWPDEITTGLFGIIRTDPIGGLNSILLRVTYKFNTLEKTYEPGWAFIDINGEARADG
jgi:putative ATP-dependent endonuclease of OLD family